nr:MAG: hypothetical protein DIU66_03170 [Bacillota bacterium]
MRPVEMQVMIPKTMEVAKVHQDQQESSKIFQSMLGVQFQKQQEIERQKINSSPKSERIQVTSEKERRREEKNKKKEKAPKKNTNHIDIKI